MAGTLMADITLNNLKIIHPRLLITRQDVEDAKRLKLAGDSAYAAAKVGAERDLKADPVKYELIGPRLLMQSRSCLARVGRFAALYLIDGDPRWVEGARRNLVAAADFPDWNPAHFLDVSEMTLAFAIGYDWLHDAWTPAERSLFRTALVEKGLREGERAYTENAWWSESSINWNLVCNGGLLAGALAVADDEPTLASNILTNAVRSLPRALRSYGSDGGYVEGPEYWDYATKYAVTAIAALTTALGTDFGLSAATGFTKGGDFRRYMIGPTGRPFNFADGTDDYTKTFPWLHWSAKTFNRPQDHVTAELGESSGEFLALFWRKAENGPTVEAPLSRSFKDVPVASIRSAWNDPSAGFVGLYAGVNHVSHSHLEMGTFVFDALGERWIRDLGKDDYAVPAYFTKDRAGIYRISTRGQNTVIIDGTDQATSGKGRIARMGRAFAVADLTTAYPDKLDRFERGVRLVHEGRGLMIRDEIEARLPVDYEWRAHTTATVHVADNVATLTLNGKQITVRVLDADATLEAETAFPDTPGPGHPAFGRQSNNAQWTRIRIRMPQKTSSATITVLLSPAHLEPEGVLPLGEWQ